MVHSWATQWSVGRSVISMADLACEQHHSCLFAFVRTFDIKAEDVRLPSETREEEIDFNARGHFLLKAR